MTDCVYTGAASNVRQVDTITIALTWAQADTITLTIGGVDFVVTIGTLTTTAQVATTLKQAFNGETLTDTSASYNVFGGAIAIPQFRMITASVSGSVVTLTQSSASWNRFPGKPWVMTITGDGTAGDGTATLANVTAATGKHHANNADNWSNALAHGVRLIFPSGCPDCLYNLTLSIQPSEIIVMKGSGKIGLAYTNNDDQGYPYYEYLGRYLVSGSNSASSTATIGLGDGDAARRINIDFSTLAFTVTVYGSGSREITSIPPICLKGSNTSNVLTNYAGDVGWNYFPEETGGDLSVCRNSGTSAKTFLGSGVSLGDSTIVCAGGYMETNSLTTTSSSIAVTGGKLVINTGNQLAITVSEGGSVALRNTGSTITTLTMYGGTVTKETAGALTITNVLQLYQGAKFLAPDGNVTLSAGFKLNGCALRDVTIDVGENHTYTVSA